MVRASFDDRVCGQDQAPRLRTLSGSFLIWCRSQSGPPRGASPYRRLRRTLRPAKPSRFSQSLRLLTELVTSSGFRQVVHIEGALSGKRAHAYRKGAVDIAVDNFVDIDGPAVNRAWATTAALRVLEECGATAAKTQLTVSRETAVVALVDVCSIHVHALKSTFQG
jgi:hypothetical protein